MKKNLRFKLIISLFLIIIATSIVMPIKLFAIDKQYLEPDQFDNASYNKLSDTDIGGTGISIGGVIVKILSVILTLVRILAVGWAIVMAVMIAIKYMTGSAQIKSQLKTDMPTYIVGAVILFGSAGLITLIQYFVEDIIK